MLTYSLELLRKIILNGNVFRGLKITHFSRDLILHGGPEFIQIIFFL